MRLPKKCDFRHGLIAAVLPFALLQSPNASADAAPTVDAPAGTQEIETLTATGVQAYSCEYDGAHQLGWKFKSPLASLYDDRGRLAVHHFAGPAWRAGDGSEIKAKVLSQAPSPTSGAIPWLLLKVTTHSGKGLLSKAHYVRRIDTVGGAAPSAPCVKEHDKGESPYFARYMFLE